MKTFADLDVGAATHTGRVRRANEDDFLLWLPEDVALVRRRGRMFALADGMGGVTGGAEASRAAVRALASVFVAEDAALDDREHRLRAGFDRACRRVFEVSHESPGLRGMGTTLTVLNLVGEQAVIGHVGDTRCYLWRDGKLDQLTEDHALRGRENRLTRCIGGGRDSEEMDVLRVDVRRHDRFLLASDGLWDSVALADIKRAVGTMAPQAAAEHLVRLANERGGPDNSTAIVVHVVEPLGKLGHLREVNLPAEETRRAPDLPGGSPPLRAVRWPWLLLTASAALGGLAIAKINGFDVLMAAREFWPG